MLIKKGQIFSTSEKIKYSTEKKNIELICLNGKILYKAIKNIKSNEIFYLDPNQKSLNMLCKQEKKPSTSYIKIKLDFKKAMENAIKNENDKTFPRPLFEEEKKTKKKKSPLFELQKKKKSPSSSSSPLFELQKKKSSISPPLFEEKKNSEFYSVLNEFKLLLDNAVKTYFQQSPTTFFHNQYLTFSREDIIGTMEGNRAKKYGYITSSVLDLIGLSLSVEFPNIGYVNTGFSKMIEKNQEAQFETLDPSLKEKDIIFIPFNGGQHWSLVVFYVKENIIDTLDSYTKANKISTNEFGKKIDAYWKQEHPGPEAKVILRKDIPRQPNAVDCGVYVIFFMMLLSYGKYIKENSFEHQDVRDFRPFLTNLIQYIVQDEEKKIEKPIEIFQEYLETNILPTIKYRNFDEYVFSQADIFGTLIPSSDDLDNKNGLITDNVIDLVGSTLSKQFNHVGYVNTTTSTFIQENPKTEFKQKPFEVEEKDIIFIPFNKDKNHWCLLSFHTNEKKIQVYDSLGSGDDAKHFAKILKKLFHLPKDIKVQTRTEIPKQPNFKDCGVYVMLYMIYISQRIEIKENTFSHQQINDFREFLTSVVTNIIMLPEKLKKNSPLKITKKGSKDIIEFSS